MSDLKLILFGTPHFEFHGQIIEDIPGEAIAIATYLALTDRPQTCDKIAALLWNGQDDASRLALLHNSLDNLKNLSSIVWLTENQNMVGINAEMLEIDAMQFIKAVTHTRTHLHSNGQLCEDCTTSLKQAAALYQGDFLAGLSIPKNTEFYNWQSTQQEWLKRECTNALRRLAEHSALSAMADAIGYVQRWIVINPLDEQAHRLLMRLYVLNGQRDEALAQYRKCVRLLNEELATPPENETTALYDIIQKGETPSLVIGNQQASTQTFAITSVLPPMPALVIGRARALTDIKARLGIPSSETKQPVIVIEGLPGVGKSTTIGALAHDPELKTIFPDGILWTSLGETPNLLSSLMVWGEVLHLISPGKTPRLEDLSKQIAAALRERKMLLIVDDVWQIEHTEPFQVNGEDCALIITSRLTEVAQALASTSSDVYRLSVLSDEYALSLLSQLAPEVVSEHQAEAAELVHNLEGLPLAIQVAGRLLREEISKGWGITDLLDELRDGSSLLMAQAPVDMRNGQGHTPPTVAALLKRSTDSLDEEMLVRFALLSLFVPKPATFDLRAMAAAWDIDDPKPTARQLINRGLIEPISGGRFQMHALLVMHSKSLLERA